MTHSHKAQEVTIDGVMYAIIVRADYKQKGISFFTPQSFSQQLGYMQHPAGTIIDAHVHNPVPREISYTQEVLVLRKGKLRVDIYTQDREYKQSVLLTAGDVIVLACGGHGFEVLEEVEMFEIKQGPYAGDADKTRFSKLDPQKIAYFDK